MIYCDRWWTPNAFRELQAAGPLSIGAYVAESEYVCNSFTQNLTRVVNRFEETDDMLDDDAQMTCRQHGNPVAELHENDFYQAIAVRLDTDVAVTVCHAHGSPADKWLFTTQEMFIAHRDRVHGDIDFPNVTPARWDPTPPTAATQPDWTDRSGTTWRWNFAMQRYDPVPRVIKTTTDAF